MNGPRVYYNDSEPDCVAAIRELIADGLIPDGEVDGRSIRDIDPRDLEGFEQVHLFAGFGGWPLAARLAGWPAGREIWSASFPCQPYSAAGKRRGTDDPRHLWPDGLRLIRARRPAVIVGEQVAGSAGYGWFDGVQSDLAPENYASRAVDVPAVSVDAPHIRNRLMWIAERMADAEEFGSGTGLREDGSEQHRAFAANGHGGDVADSDIARLRSVEPARERRGQGGTEATVLGRRDSTSGSDVRSGVTLGDAERAGLERFRGDGDDGAGQSLAPRSASPPDGRNGTFWSDAEWIICHDGKARRTKPGLRLLVDGGGRDIHLGSSGWAHEGAFERLAKEAGVTKLPNIRIALWRGAGNGICIPLAVEVIRAYLDDLAERGR